MMGKNMRIYVDVGFDETIDQLAKENSVHWYGHV